MKDFIATAEQLARRYPKATTFIGSSLVIGGSFVLWHAFDRHALPWRDVAEQVMATMGAATATTLLADAGGCHHPVVVRHNNKRHNFDV